jgi:hypothetical protein
VVCVVYPKSARKQRYRLGYRLVESKTKICQSVNNFELYINNLPGPVPNGIKPVTLLCRLITSTASYTFISLSTITPAPFPFLNTEWLMYGAAIMALSLHG